LSAMNSLSVILLIVSCATCFGLWNKAPVPIFLAEATDEAKEAFYQIIINSNLSQQQKEAAIEQFISGQPQNIQIAFQVFQQKMQEVKDQFDQSIQQELNSLTVDARNALAELDGIRLDDRLTDEQKQAKILAFYNSLKASVQEELKKLNPMIAQPLAGGNRIPVIGGTGNSNSGSANNNGNAGIGIGGGASAAKKGRKF